MHFLVENCFHWVGFHIVTYFLENGDQVDGIDSIATDKKEHLSMFIGRNASFRHLAKTENNRSYDLAIKVEDDKTITLQNHKSVTIEVPMLFGEWMPMNDEGIFQGEEFIRFDSTAFFSSAVYIESFLKSLHQCVAANKMPPYLQIYAANHKQGREEGLENLLYIRNNRPIESAITKVREHYERYKAFY